MLRPVTRRWSCAIALALCGVNYAEAGSLSSAPVVLNAFEDKIAFDFSAVADQLNPRPALTGLEVFWKVSPGASTVQAQITAGLAIPSFQAGDRLNSSLEMVLPTAGQGPATAKTSFLDVQGLPIGPAALDQYLTDDDMVGAELVMSGEGAADIAAFFEAGGSIQAQLQLLFDSEEPTPPPVPGPAPSPRGPGGGAGGGNVPEPMSLAIWGAAGALALRRRRRVSP